MTYEMQILLFVAVVATYLILVGVLLHRELSVEARENHTEYQKTPRPATGLDTRRRLWRKGPPDGDLPGAVRYHFERLRPRPADTERRLENRGCLPWEPLDYRITCGTWYVRLEEEVRHLFYIRFPSQAIEHEATDGTAYSEMEEQVRFHFHKLRPTLETERESAD